jgi:DNA-directed RNA polymerase III subunit RPC11
MLFCPMCGNMLMVEDHDDPQQPGIKQRWYCKTCPYICPIKNKYKNRLQLEKKRIDEYVQGGTLSILIYIL